MLLPFVVLELFAFAYGWVSTGHFPDGLFALAVMAPFIALTTYFFAAGRRGKPSRTEKTLAWAWILVRRIVCFTGALFMGSGAVLYFWWAVKGHKDGSFFAAAALGALAAVCAWHGMYGTADENSLAEDRRLHLERMRRYGWSREGRRKQAGGRRH